MNTGAVLEGMWKKLTPAQRRELMMIHRVRRKYYADYYPPIKKLTEHGLVVRDKSMYQLTEIGDAVAVFGQDKQ